MTNSQQEHRIEKYSQKIYEALDTDLLIPTVFLEKEWTIRNTKNYSFYVSKPYPIYFIDALYEMFKDSFTKSEIDPNGTILTSGSPRHMPTPKKRLMIQKRRVNPQWAGGSVKNPKMVWKRLVVRWKENSVTLEYWNRGSKLYLFKDGELDENPSQFMYNILKHLNYPFYVVKDAVRKGIAQNLVRIINIIKTNNIRGWRIEL